jgi:hypothetical protein
MRMRPGTSLLFFGALALAACSQPAPTKAPEAPAPPSAAAAPAPEPVAAIPPQPSATVGGDGSSIELSALTASDLDENKLEGELACSFSTSAASPLVIARGDVASKDAAFGLVKVTGYVEHMAAPGGFDGMLKGAVFSGQGKTVTIALTGPATAGGESPPRPATLTYDRADGAKRVYPGLWTCGP